MGKENINRGSNEINEELMMSLMADGVQKDGIRLENLKEGESAIGPTEKPNSIDRSKKKKYSAEYERIFFKRTETNARDGKTVYVRPDFHEKLTRIAQVIGEDKITIYGYLDNLLEYHFQEFGDQIIASFNDKYKPII
ncbi:conjugal transfer protein TraB [Flavobacterium collinsii]|nr:conjugal transfer protein TraB [Flavobacterium collinsii]